MRFDTAALFAALATTCAADSLWVSTECYEGSCKNYATFYTSYGSYGINADSGCRGATAVPGMTEFCMDWDRSRAHFKFSHQSYKRCLVMQSKTTIHPVPSFTSAWVEVGCTWRLPAPEVDDTVTANGTAQATVSVVAADPLPAASDAPQN
ncbi:hypothetical protein EsH8_V_001035 [Colletotrichum jinshuiense]